jgi:hypothetical protein
MSQSNVVQMFSKPNIASSMSDNHYTDELSSWKEKNAIISDGFHKESVFQKQRTLDAVLAMNEELVELVLKLKGEKK